MLLKVIALYLFGGVGTAYGVWMAGEGPKGWRNQYRWLYVVVLWLLLPLIALVLKRRGKL